MVEAKRATVTVGCKVPNGIMLNLWKKGYDDGTGDGERPTIRDGVGIRLNGPSSINTGAGAPHRDDLHAETEVDAGWWAKWAEQNKLNPYLVEGFIFEVKKEEVPAGNPTP